MQLLNKVASIKSSVAISPAGRKIWVNVPQWSTKLNQYLWTTPVMWRMRLKHKKSSKAIHA